MQEKIDFQKKNMKSLRAILQKYLLKGRKINFAILNSK